MKTLVHLRLATVFPRCVPLFLVCLFLCLAGPAAHAAYRVELEAPAPLKELLSTHLDLMRYREREDINADQFSFMIATAADQVARLASTEGYFSTNTKVEVDRASGTTVVRLRVDAGARTRVSQVDIDVTGAASRQSPAQVAAIHRQWPLRAGEPFRQPDWAEAKQSGLEILHQVRYPAARIADSEALVNADRQQAALAISYDSGPLFTVGEPVISGTSRYPERIIRNLNPLRIGEEYSVERLLEFQRQVLRTPYFSNVVVDIDKNPSNAERAPVQVAVTEFPTQRISGGAGFTTDTGAHLEGLYSHTDVLGRAWVLDAQTRLEQRRQFGALDLAMPPARGGFIHSMHGSIERTTLEGVDLRSRRLRVRRARTSDKRDTAYSIEYYRDKLEQLSGAPLPPDIVAEPGSHQALVAGFERTRRQVDDLLFPRKGRMVFLQAGVAIKGVLTDQTFFRTYARLREYVPIGRRDLVILRAELGAVVTKGGNAAIPASLLFRAGGNESVRGYSYQSIGIERGGTVYPARYLATGGAEYQHWISERWGGAVFYDVGLASDSWHGKSLFHGIGFGVRWHSPVGRLQADLAYGFQDNKIRPHLSLGAAF
ncbi:MAG: autotransporter assembly complex family protein [Pseudomonadota bacterium]